MKRRLSAFLLAGCILAAMLPTSAFAAVSAKNKTPIQPKTSAKSEAKVKASGNVGKLKWELSTDGVLTISGRDSMKDFEVKNEGTPQESVDSPWYAYRNDIDVLIVEDGVKNIGDRAFRECEYLKSVSLPESLTKIGRSAFALCVRLKEVEIPDGVTRINRSAFYECSKLKTVTFPDTLANMEGTAFARCSSLESITIPKSMSRIEYNAFENCVNLEEINIMGRGFFIGSNAFKGVTADVNLFNADKSWDDKIQDYGGDLTWYSVD